MAILIKGMEMPDRCFLCRFCRRQEYGEYVGEDTAWSCVASKKRITDGQDLIATFKHPDCPLVEAAEVQDAVSRQAAIDAVFKEGHGTIKERLEALPPAQAKQKKGKWNTYYHGVNEDQVFTYSCNQCGYSAPYGLYGGKYSQKKWAYCPNCGADMRGEQNA